MCLLFETKSKSQFTINILLTTALAFFGNIETLYSQSAGGPASPSTTIRIIPSNPNLPETTFSTGLIPSALPQIPGLPPGLMTGTQATPNNNQSPAAASNQNTNNNNNQQNFSPFGNNNSNQSGPNLFNSSSNAQSGAASSKGASNNTAHSNDGTEKKHDADQQANNKKQETAKNPTNNADHQKDQVDNQNNNNLNRSNLVDSSHHIDSAARDQQDSSADALSPVESEEFLKQELRVILLSNDSEYYAIAPTDYEKSVSHQERIELKQRLARDIKRIEGMTNIYKLMAVNYKIANPTNFPRTEQNAHLPVLLTKSDYENMAFDAAGQGDIGALKTLIDNYISINTKNSYGETLLIYSVLSGQIDSVRLLLAKGVNIEATDNDGETALHIAVIKENAEIVKDLLIMGAQPDKADKFGKTAKDYAINKQNDNIINMIDQVPINLSKR